VLRGDAGDDWLRAGHGADIVDGGDGNDELDGGPGQGLGGAATSDTIFGGAGDDVLNDTDIGSASDVLDGGPGIDTVHNAWALVPVWVSLNGLADDGAAGEGDNVIAVEAFDRATHLTFVGDDGPNTVSGAVSAQGLGGDDVLSGTAGDDQLDGGDGNDRLIGLSGDDTLIGGAGVDTFYGDREVPNGICDPIVGCINSLGNDTIQAVDGNAENITCGAGDDSVTADAADRVAPDCEHVSRSGPPAGCPPSCPPPTKPAQISLPGSAAKKLSVTLTRGLRLPVAVDRAGKIEVSVQLAGKQAKQLHLRAAIATARASVTTARQLTLTARFTTVARRRLRHVRLVKLTVKASFTGLDGATATAARTLTLRRS
jgi:hypothetical protein